MRLSIPQNLPPWVPEHGPSYFAFSPKQSLRKGAGCKWINQKVIPGSRSGTVARGVGSESGKEGTPIEDRFYIVCSQGHCWWPGGPVSPGTSGMCPALLARSQSTGINGQAPPFLRKNTVSLESELSGGKPREAEGMGYKSWRKRACAVAALASPRRFHALMLRLCSLLGLGCLYPSFSAWQTPAHLSKPSSDGTSSMRPS